MPRQTSTELVIPTTSDLCRQVIHYTGTDRSTEMQERYDSDWQQRDHDGQELNVRLVQQQLGGSALYTLRVEDAASRQRSNYRIAALPENVEQRISLPGGNTAATPWPPSTVNYLLLGAFDN